MKRHLRRWWMTVGYRLNVRAANRLSAYALVVLKSGAADYPEGQALVVKTYDRAERHYDRARRLAIQLRWM